MSCNVGALIIRTEFWGILYNNYNKEPQTSIGKYKGPCIGLWSSGLGIFRGPVNF